MILALEGIEGVGKSTVASLVAGKLDMKVYRDPGKDDLLRREFEGVRDGMFWKMIGAQNLMNVAEFGKLFDFVVDRWAMSSWVYDGFRNNRLPPGFYKDLMTGVSGKIFVLNLEPRVAYERHLRRDGKERRSLDQLKKLRDAYLESVQVMEGAGMPTHVVHVDDFDTPYDVADRILREW